MEVNEPLTKKPFEKYEVKEMENGSMLKDGYYKRWHRNGQLEIDCYYLSNKKNGPYKIYYENSVLGQDANYKDDLLDGHSITYNESGQKSWEGNFSSGKQIGEWTNWFDTGEKRAVFKYSDGLLDGHQTEWYRNGNIAIEGDLAKGVKIGVWKMYDENKLVVRIYRYVNGQDQEVIGKWKVSNGNIIEYFQDMKYTLVEPNGEKTTGPFELKDESITLKGGLIPYRYTINKLTDSECEFSDAFRSYTMKKI